MGKPRLCLCFCLVVIPPPQTPGPVHHAFGMVGMRTVTQPPGRCLCCCLFSLIRPSNRHFDRSCSRLLRAAQWRNPLLFSTLRRPKPRLGLSSTFPATNLRVHPSRLCDGWDRNPYPAAKLLLLGSGEPQGKERFTSHPSRITRNTAGIPAPPLPRDPLHIPTLSQRLQRLRRQSASHPPVPNHRPHILPERTPEALLRLHQPALLLQLSKPSLIDQRRLRINLLRRHDGLHHRLHLALQVVALVDHERNALTLLVTYTQNFMKDPEHLVRIDRPQRQVVIGILPVVEMKSTQLSQPQQPRHNLFNVRPLIMMPRIHQHLRLRPR